MFSYFHKRLHYFSGKCRLMPLSVSCQHPTPVRKRAPEVKGHVLITWWVRGRAEARATSVLWSQPWVWRPSNVHQLWERQEIPQHLSFPICEWESTAASPESPDEQQQKGLDLRPVAEAWTVAFVNGKRNLLAQTWPEDAGNFRSDPPDSCCF